MTELTVLLPVKHVDEKLFADALDSLACQSLQALRILILNAGDADQVEAVVDRLADPRFEIVRCPPAETLTEQLNRGIALANTTFIARADADDLNEPCRLERQVEYLDSHPRVAVLGTGLKIIDATGALVGKRTYPTTHAAITKAMHSSNAIAHPTVVFRKSAVQQVGGYRWTGRPAQDYELWSRMIHENFQFANLHSVDVRYRLHDSSTKTSRLKQTLRNTLEIKRKYWWPTMTRVDRARYRLEFLLQFFPAKLVERMFITWQYRPTNQSEAENDEQRSDQ